MHQKCGKISHLTENDANRSGQFHQHFTFKVFVRKCFFRQNITREKLREALSYKNRVRKMLVKLIHRRMTFVNSENWSHHAQASAVHVSIVASYIILPAWHRNTYGFSIAPATTTTPTSRNSLRKQ